VDGPGVRASDAERDRTVERLRDAAAEGRLTFEELADRIGVASAATHQAELERVTSDLPAPAAVAAPTIEFAHSSVTGDLERKGAWVVPERSRWQAVFGDVRLDLREARVGASVVTIEVASVFGDIDLLVPEGIAVEVRVRTILGDVRQEAGDAADSGAPRVVVTGWSVFGDVKVRARRLREKLADRLLGSAD
jgi:Domain of unknown function (DUF1707)/Cell wall-active antibiotics response 4TMS YvqF